ncbi:YbaB/EbfC family nucleoid-associated protein [Streptomyces nigra]|uniref:YbaB/EbfC family nucleoid-associated protein n=1 Tax=Streptomyces nigra TaxID=1827580 RepID=UPI003455CD9B
MVILLGTVLHALPKGELPTSGQRWFRSTSEYWVVNLAVENMSLAVELDSADPGLRFHGTIDVDWRIADPRLAVERGNFDVERLLRRMIVPRLSTAAKDCVYDAVRELEERLAREQFTGESGDGLLKVVDISFDLRPDPGATEILRTGALEQMRRSQATAVLEQGDIGITADVMMRNPEIAEELLRNMRDDKRLVLLAQLEAAKAVHAREGGEDHERAHPFDELLTRLGVFLSGGTNGLPLPRPADGPLQLDGVRPGPRDRRAQDDNRGEGLDGADEGEDSDDDGRKNCAPHGDQ